MIFCVTRRREFRCRIRDAQIEDSQCRPIGANVLLAPKKLDLRAWMVGKRERGKLRSTLDPSARPATKIVRALLKGSTPSSLMRVKAPATFTTRIITAVCSSLTPLTIAHASLTPASLNSELAPCTTVCACAAPVARADRMRPAREVKQERRVITDPPLAIAARHLPGGGLPPERPDRDVQSERD